MKFFAATLLLAGAESALSASKLKARAITVQAATTIVMVRRNCLDSGLGGVSGETGSCRQPKFWSCLIKKIIYY